MNPAARIIEKFGGVRPLARALGCAPSTVSRWAMARDQGGTGGMIPTGKISAVMDAAKKGRVKLKAADLMPE